MSEPADEAVPAHTGIDYGVGKDKTEVTVVTPVTVTSKVTVTKAPAPLSKPETNLRAAVELGFDVLHRHPMFKRFTRGTTPQAGDVVLLSNGPQLTERVLSFLNPRTTELHYWVVLEMDGGKQERRELPIDGRLLDGVGVLGWVPGHVFG